jgi:hypothetical protein
MTDKVEHIAWAAEAIAVFQRHCRTGDEHAIADLICNLGHLAEARGIDFLSEVKRGIRTRSIMLVTATISGQTPQSRSSSHRSSRDPANSSLERRHSRRTSLLLLMPEQTRAVGHYGRVYQIPHSAINSILAGKIHGSL